MDSTAILAVLAVYLVTLLLAGVWARRESATLVGYFLAGRKLPGSVVAFSSNATGESGWLLLGLTGMGYLVGVHALWVALGEVLGVAIAWVFVARPFKAWADRAEAVTVADVLEYRFADRSQRLRAAAIVIVLSMVLFYLAAQFVATGKAFQSFLGLSYPAGVLLGAAITIFYTSIGGFKAVAYTDVLQGVLMAVGLLVLAVVGFSAAGGWVSTLDQLAQADPALLLPMGQAGLSITGIASALSLAGVGLAFLGVPQLLVRFMAARNDRELVSGSLIAVVCIVIFDCSAIFAGIAGRVLFPGLADPETIMPQMSVQLFPPLLTGILVVVVLGAIMSTVDSLLILASSAVVRDLIQKILRPGLPMPKLSQIARVTTLVIGLAALPLALSEARVVFWFVLFAWSGLAAAFAPVVLCGLFWRRTTAQGALAGMIGGFVTTVVWILFLKASFYDLYEMLPGFGVGLLMTVSVSLATRPPAEVLDDFDSIAESVGNPFRRSQR